MKPFFKLLLITIVFYACNAEKKEAENAISPPPQTNSILPDTIIIAIDSLKKQVKDSIVKPISIVKVKKENTRELRSQLKEVALYNNLNGGPVNMELDLPQKVLIENPDTIKSYLKMVYLGQEGNFPRSIADNFEKGISTERISYPKIIYSIKIYDDAYAKKPYKVIAYTVSKKHELIVVE